MPKQLPGLAEVAFIERLEGERHLGHVEVAPGVFRHAVPHRRRSREHRLAVQVTFEVQRQVAGRLVPARTVLFEALHRDPIQVAFDFGFPTSDS